MLLVEDDAALRELYRQALTAVGYAVVAVEDGFDALRQIVDRGVRPHAIVLDLALPRLSGLDLHQELQAHAITRHIPIVVTGTDTREFDATKFACVFRKPASTDALIKAIDACLR